MTDPAAPWPPPRGSSGSAGQPGGSGQHGGFGPYGPGGVPGQGVPGTGNGGPNPGAGSGSSGPGAGSAGPGFGTGFGRASRSGRGPARPPSRSPISKRVLWAAGIVAVVALLLGPHRISSDDVILFCVIIPSIILHEISHGWVAHLFGDDTAKRAGRLTLNPVAHIDPIGTLILPALMVVSTGFLFGWAKPVPVDLRRLRSPRNQGLLVALAGPATNLLLAGIAAVVFRVAFHNATSVSLGLRIVFFLGFANLILAIYNMIPVPPLDGSALLERALPAEWWPRYLRIRQYMLPALVVAMVLGVYIHVGGTSLVSHLSQAVYNWWVSLIGLG